MSSRLKFGILIVCLLTASLSLYVWSIIRSGFSALDPPSAAETVIARGVRQLAIPSKARDAKNPVESSPKVLEAAMEHFSDHCAICHGNDGKGRTLIGKGLYPKPPDMTLEQTQRLTTENSTTSFRTEYASPVCRHSVKQVVTSRMKKAGRW
jgi:hypothetical protein